MDATTLLASDISLSDIRYLSLSLVRGAEVKIHHGSSKLVWRHGRITASMTAEDGGWYVTSDRRGAPCALFTAEETVGEALAMVATCLGL